MNAYQDFLDFFSMHNKERLDGLSESYFIAMNEQERDMAFRFLLERVADGGTEESVNGLFMADFERAIEPVRKLLEAGKLNADAQLAAAWNLSKIWDDDCLSQVFARFMSDPDYRLRAKAIYYVPDDMLHGNLELCLRGVIRTEVEQLPRVHAVNKILKIYNISKQSIGERNYREIYQGLHSDEPQEVERALNRLEAVRRSG
jgi:hypothetical protein